MSAGARRSYEAGAKVRQFPQARAVVRFDDLQRQDHRPAEGWQQLRGTVLTTETVELVAGFPGSATHGNRLRRARLTITEEWLVINDGKTDGFALAFDQIDSLTVVPGSARSRYAIQIRYREGREHRNFFIKFADAVWPFRAGSDSLRIATLLAELGVDVVPIDPESNHKQLAMSAPDMRKAALETMVWSGDITGPIGGWLTQHRSRCQAWLTTSSFIWRRDEGSGVNRILLEDVISAFTGTRIDQESCPIVLLSVLDGVGDRHELPFIFDTQRGPDENRRECAALLGGLRMRDIPVAIQPPPLRPWTGIGSLLAAADASCQDDGPLPPQEHRRVSAGEFEAHYLIDIARLNRDIVGYVPDVADSVLAPVQNVSHAAAASELERRFEAGELSKDAMLEQRSRFKALIEARGKLAAIAEQRAQGTRPAGILMHQRDAVMSSLNAAIMPDAPVQSESLVPMKIELVQPRMHLRLLPNPRLSL
ncbi:MAG: hypothetical protein WKF81_02255 [Thermomicrobiales bacterium]